MPKPLALIIEDDTNLSRIFSLALQTDFETEIYGDGSTAFMRLANAEPTVVVLDLNLPGLQGKDILADIRANRRLANTGADLNYNWDNKEGGARYRAGGVLLAEDFFKSGRGAFWPCLDKIHKRPR